VVGSLVGGGISWLANWTTTRRTSKEARDERRRTAYAAFLAAAEELGRLMTTARVGAGFISGPSLQKDLAAMIGPIDRTQVAIALVGPQTVQQAADDVRRKAWELLTGCVTASGPWTRRNGRY
jgi:hypothetical protein